MNAAVLIARLAVTPEALDTLLAGLSDDDWRLRPAARTPGPAPNPTVAPGEGPTGESRTHGGWSILEVVNHLADEEVEDFRARLRSTLEDPAREWAPIDPERAVRDRAYQERDPAESLRRFRAAREESLAWLRALPEPRWDNAKTHPRAGTLHAGDLLASWAAHDARHLQQIAKRLHLLAAHHGAPYSVEYAG